MFIFTSLLVSIAGLVIGLGSVIVIDIHGFCGRRSPYWTETTIRVHKITKPLIWIGVVLFGVGGSFYYALNNLYGIMALHLLIIFILILNGFFLSFVVSPFLLSREKAGKAHELLPSRLQFFLSFSFVISFIGWWGSLLLLTLIISFAS